MRLRLGSVEHDLTTRTLVMGMLHPRPSSWPAPGETLHIDAVLARAQRLVADGADVLDLGGVPDAEVVGEAPELDLLVPAVEALAARFEAPVAVDTRRPRVLSACCAAGALMAGDPTGFADPDYLGAAAQAGATVIATHAGPRRPPGAPARRADDLVAEVRAFLDDRVTRAVAAGVPEDRVVVDAGLDLGKSAGESLTLLRESAALADLGPPLLLSASDKRFLGTLLDLEVDERRVAGHAAEALGIARGGRIIRASDVRGAKRVATVLQALLAARLEQVERAWATPQERHG